MTTLKSIKLKLRPRTTVAALFLFALAYSAYGQSILAELKAEQNPARRSEMALSFADVSFETAKDLYHKGDVRKADEQLDNMTSALSACVDSLAVANKAKFYKKAEMKVAMLQRRLSDLVSDLGIQERGWAEQTNRHLEEIHDKLLNGVMRK